MYYNMLELINGDAELLKNY